MPVPSAISDLSQTPGDNSPPGSESPTTADNYLRSYAAFIATLRDGKGFSTEQDLASAATCDVGAVNSLFLRITGTTTIMSLGTNYTGPRLIRFAAALTLTHNASSLVLPGGANITTAAGDTCIATPISGGWVINSYQRADGKSVIGALTSATAQAASGASVTFSDIPSWVRRITVTFVGVSASSTDSLYVRIGDSGGIENSGYSSVTSTWPNGSAPALSAYTDGFGIRSTSAATVLHGSMTLTLQTGNVWVCTGTFANPFQPEQTVTAGSKTLSGTLDRLNIAPGSGTLDAGVINILYE